MLKEKWGHGVQKQALETVHISIPWKETCCISHSPPALFSDHQHKITFAFLSGEPSAAQDENRKHECA